MSGKQAEFGETWGDSMYVKEDIGRAEIEFILPYDTISLSKEKVRELIKFLITLTNEEINDD